MIDLKILWVKTNDFIEKRVSVKTNKMSQKRKLEIYTGVYRATETDRQV